MSTEQEKEKHQNASETIRDPKSDAIFDARRNFFEVINRHRNVLPTGPKQEYDPNLKQVGIAYLQGSNEYSQFRTNDSSKFNTYGYDDAERERATLTFNPAQKVWLDSRGEIVQIPSTIYNVTREGKLIIELLDMQGMLNHSSITKDGAVICAGYITIKNGKITELDNNSGHYKPSTLNLYNTIKTLQKDGEAQFDENCIIRTNQVGAQSLPRVLDFTLTQFIDYMEEEINIDSTRVPRYKKMQQDAIEEAAKMLENHAQIRKFKLSDSSLPPPTISTLILSTPWEKEVKANNRYNFPSQMFEPSYVAEYEQYMGIQGKYKATTLTLTTQQLFHYLQQSRDPNAQEAMKYLITKVSKDHDFINVMYNTGGVLWDECLSDSHIGNILQSMKSKDTSNIPKEMLPKVQKYLESNLDNPIHLDHLAYMAVSNMFTNSHDSITKLISHDNIEKTLASVEAMNSLLKISSLAEHIGGYICRDNESIAHYLNSPEVKKILPNLILTSNIAAARIGQYMFRDGNSLENYLNSPEAMQILENLISKDDSTTMQHIGQHLCRDNMAYDHLMNIWGVPTVAKILNSLDPPSIYALSEKIIFNIINDPNREKNMRILSSLYFEENEFINAALVNHFKELSPYISSNHLIRDLYIKLTPQNQQEMKSLWLSDLHSDNDASVLKAIDSLHLIQQGDRVDPSLQNQIVAWDIQNIKKIESSQSASINLATAINNMDETHRNDIYTAIRSLEAPNNILSSLLLERDPIDLATIIQIAEEKTRLNPGFKIKGLASNNQGFDNLIESAGDDLDTQASIIKLAVRHNSPYEALNGGDEAVYRTEQKDHILRQDVIRIAQPVKEAMTPRHQATTHAVLPHTTFVDKGRGVGG